ncbi:hypothetical protein [Haliea sp. E17]|uniref:hypothetical protein n=1 Tax=Haliea sp. E17 TaxID=3401576 RepID=UPI003AB044FF
MKHLLSFIALLTFSLPNAANQLSDILESKPPSEQEQIFLNVLIQSGKPCGKVTRTFLQGSDKDDAAYWNVACDNGQSYVVQIPADPTSKTRVLDCSLMKAMGSECFTKFSS